MGKIMADVAIRMQTDTAELNKGLKKANQRLKGFEKQAKKISNNLKTQFKQMGAAIGAAFAIKAIANFSKEAAVLAGEVQGVELAFKRLKNSEKVLADLKKATAGTVSELTLMQRAIQAENFNIPMDALAAGLEFATKRAAQTGESVDYLVESFVKGLGRKSVLILDNLGISALALNEEIAKTGDFMQGVINITQNELGKMGEVLLTDAQKMEKFRASAADAKAEFGNLVLKAILPFINVGNKLFENANKQSKALLAERSELNRLVGAATSATISEKARLRIIEDIQQKYPAFIGNIDAETLSNTELLKKLDKVNTSYKERIKLSILQEALAEEEGKLSKKIANEINLTEELNLAKGALARAQENYNQAVAEGSPVAQAYLDHISTWSDRVKNLEQRLGRNADRQEKWTSQINKTTDAVNRQLEVLDKLGIDGSGSLETTVTIDKGTSLEEYKKWQKDIKHRKEFNIQMGIDMSQELKDNKLMDGLVAENEKAIKEMLSQEEDYVEQKKIIDIEGEKRIAEAKKALTQQENRDKLAIGLESAAMLTDGVASLFEAQKQRELKAAGKNEKKIDAINLKYAKKEKAIAISQAIIGTSLAVINALQTKPFLPMGPIMAGVAGAAGGLQIAAIAGTPLAEGGLAYKPTNALIGEYANARTNPEVVAPLDKLKNMLGNNNGMFGEVVFTIDGAKLVGVLEKQRTINAAY